MKLKISNLKKLRPVFSTMLILAGSSLATMTKETLAGILFILLGLFIETAAFTVNRQDSFK
jgi:hypothetical protein